MKYSVDSYGNLLSEVDPTQEDEYTGEFDWFYEVDDEADETPRWIENKRVEKTDWWSVDTYEPEPTDTQMAEELV